MSCNKNTITNIKKRAEYLEKISNYFKDLNVLEVDTPLDYTYGVTYPFIDLFAIDKVEGRRYLQSSPEYVIKGILAKDSGRGGLPNMQSIP